MNNRVKWVLIILLIAASALLPFLIVNRHEMGSDGYGIWMALVIYAYTPAMAASPRPAWLWAVVALCVLSVVAFVVSLIKNTVTLEFQIWVNLACWANLLAWALAVGSRFAARYGRMEISGFGHSPSHPQASFHQGSSLKG